MPDARIKREVFMKILENNPDPSFAREQFALLDGEWEISFGGTAFRQQRAGGDRKMIRCACGGRSENDPCARADGGDRKMTPARERTSKVRCFCVYRSIYRDEVALYPSARFTRERLARENHTKRARHEAAPFIDDRRFLIVARFVVNGSVFGLLQAEPFSLFYASDKFDVSAFDVDEPFFAHAPKLPHHGAPVHADIVRKAGL